MSDSKEITGTITITTLEAKQQKLTLDGLLREKADIAIRAIKEKLKNNETK